MYNILELGEVKNVEMKDYKEFFSTSIYMILKLDYLLNIFKNNELYFSNIYQSWEDPYELFLLRHNCYVDGVLIRDHYLKVAKRMYGQSWSLLRDSDALWRIYSRDKMSVRIKTSFGKMLNVIKQASGIMWCAPGFGKVKYMNINDINMWVNDLVEQGTGVYDMSFMNSLFIKRNEFLHEQEIRFVLWLSGESSYKNTFSLHVNPFDLIEEIAFDPRLKENEYQSKKKDINTIIENKIPIIKSDLYAFDKLTIDLKSTPIVLESAYKL